MAILLPHVMPYNQKRNPHLYDDLTAFFPGQTDPAAAVNRFIREIGEQSGLPLRLRDTGLFDRSRIDEIAEKALNYGAMIVNPAHFSKEDVAGLLLGAE